MDTPTTESDSALLPPRFIVGPFATQHVGDDSHSGYPVIDTQQPERRIVAVYEFEILSNMVADSLNACAVNYGPPDKHLTRPTHG